MNKEEIIDKIVEMSKEIKKLKEELNKQEKPKLGRWKPKYGERYYYLKDKNILKDSRTNHIDEERYEIGNVFKTEEEAKFAIEQFKILAQLREYTNNSRVWNCTTKHWIIRYDVRDRCIETNYSYYIISIPFGIYFSSEEQAQEAIDAIGEERLKKYYFCVEE